VLGEVPAGGWPGSPVGPGEAVAVMTGSPVPPGADAVVQVEWTSGFGSSPLRVLRSASPGTNVSPRGEIARLGSTVLSAGTLLRPEEIALLAAVGTDPVPVFARPRVAVLSTGDELVPASSSPGPDRLRDANRPALLALLRHLGAEPVDLGLVADDPEAILAAVSEGLATDGLVTSGGVSEGVHDHSRDAFARAGVEVLFRALAVKPGRPTVFGTRGAAFVLGLPGNPASALVVARLLLAPAVRRRAGRSLPAPPRLRARLSTDLRKKPDRLWIVGATLDASGPDLLARPLPGLGSADLPNASRATCYILAPRGASTLEAGSPVEVLAWEP
jgi:molybdopterin molybdotransferase